jgi:Tfp pilus assembly PilM family ATPase
MLDLFKNPGGESPFSIYIKDNSLQVIQLSGTPKNFEVKSIGKAELPVGIVKNGRVILKEEFIKQLNKLLAGTTPHSIQSKACIVVLPSSHVFEHTFFLSKEHKGEKFTRELKRLVEESIPIPSDQLKFKYSVLPMKNVQTVFVSAADKTIIDEYNKLFKDYAGIQPLVYEPEVFSLIRNIPHNFKEDTGNILIKIKKEGVKWYLVWNGHIYDSNFVSQDDFLYDLAKSISLFHGESKRQISGLYIIPVDADIYEQVMKSIEKEVELPVTIIDQFRVPLNDDAITLKIVSGAGIRGITAESHDINLI